MNLDLRALIGKLNHETKGAVEAAAGLCLSPTRVRQRVKARLPVRVCRLRIRSMGAISSAVCRESIA